MCVLDSGQNLKHCKVGDRNWVYFAQELTPLVLSMQPTMRLKMINGVRHRTQEDVPGKGRVRH